MPRGGLRFGPDTEVAFQNGDDYSGYGPRRSSSALTIDWTHEQNLSSGWLSPRVPAHFVVRKGEQRRERVTFTRGADGRVEAVNGLGADLTELWYADEAGAVFRATQPISILAAPRSRLKCAATYLFGLMLFAALCCCRRCCWASCRG